MFLLSGLVCVFISCSLESNSVSALGVEALVRALQACPALELIRSTTNLFFLMLVMKLWISYIWIFFKNTFKQLFHHCAFQAVEQQSLCHRSRESPSQGQETEFLLHLMGAMFKINIPSHQCLQMLPASSAFACMPLTMQWNIKVRYYFALLVVYKY